jgi:hypothetical protein
MTAPNWARLAGRTLNKNSTTILSATAVAGVVATAVLAARAQKRVEIVIQSDSNPEYVPAEIYNPGIDKAKTKAYIKLFWKDYIPPVVTGLATIACIVGANRIGLRRQAAMLGAYALVDGAFREYKEEVLAQFGETKERKVVDEIAKRKVDENPPNDREVIITGGGEQLCYDTWSGRYFRSDVETIRQAANNVNESIIGGNMYAALNEFWAYLGLADTRAGDEMGFNLEHLVKLEFTSHLAKNGEPCLAITYVSLPVADYGKVF